MGMWKCVCVGGREWLTRINLGENGSGTLEEHLLYVLPGQGTRLKE